MINNSKAATLRDFIVRSSHAFFSLRFILNFSPFLKIPLLSVLYGTDKPISTHLISAEFQLEGISWRDKEENSLFFRVTEKDTQ